MRAIALIAALLACFLPLAVAGAETQEDPMKTLFAVKAEIPKKAAFADISIRMKQAYGTPLQSVTYCWDAGRFSMRPVFGKGLSTLSPVKDETGRFAAISGEAEYSYLLYLPEDYDGERAYPVIFFLHGIGERGDAPTVLADYGPFQYLLRGHSLPFVVIAPQLEAGSHWVEDENEAETDVQMERLSVFIAQMQQKYALDAQRIHLTGLSMGGRGTYKLSCYLPDTFASVSVCCGRAGQHAQEERFFYDLSRIAETPVWIFHGLSDKTVDADHALTAVRALRSLNEKGDLRLTLYPGVGHGCYEHAYLDAQLYAWMEECARVNAAD